jgi:hypothetical protein
VCNQAAQFGKGFIPDLNCDSYVKMCRLLRVLNAVRDHKIGIPLTCTQYPFKVSYYCPLPKVLQGMIIKVAEMKRSSILFLS